MRGPLLAILIAGTGLLAHGAGIPVEQLRSIGGLPAHLAGAFDDITACHLTRDGNFVLFDRRAQAVFAAEPGASKPRKIVQLGGEPGRVLRPLAFDSAPDGTFVIADSPAGLARIQFFVYSGGGLGGFLLPGRETLQITLGNTVVSGIASLEYTGPTVLISLPQNGQLVTEYSSDGRLLRTFGELRPTGQEHDPDVHAALNVGLPLAEPGGGFFYVFISGVPMFRKYDATGALVFERHIQGVEVDAFLGTLPTTWAREGGNLPVVPVSVRAAGVDPAGRLWVSLAEPYTYVFDRQGDKMRAVQFRAAALLSASSFFFTHDKRVLVTPGCYAFPAD
jgi:hypothetical protein